MSDGLDLFENNNIPITTNSVGDELGIGTLKGTFVSIFIWGNFGTGTVTIQVSPEPGVWFETGVSTGANAVFNLDIAYRSNNLKIRAQLANSTDAAVRAVMR